MLGNVADLFAHSLDIFTQMMNISGFFFFFFFLVVQGDLWKKILNGKFASLLGESRHMSLSATAGFLEVSEKWISCKSHCIKN